MNFLFFKTAESFVKRILIWVNREKEMEQKLILLINLNEFISRNHCGFFSNPQIELLLAKIAKSIFKEKTECRGKPNSFLHVMSLAYATGGHTRVVERMILNRELRGESHHIALTMQGGEKLPASFSNFTLFNLSSNSLQEKIVQLHLLAKDYDYIILHHHEWDIIPAVAFSKHIFGHNKIIIYNHADRLYWVGASVSNLVLDLGKDGSNFSLKRRGIRSSKVLPIPLVFNSNNLAVSEIEEFKTQKNIPTNKRIVLSIGATSRFVTKTDEYSFKNLIEDLHSQFPDVFFVIVGKVDDSFWGKYINDSRILFTGPINREDLDIYINCADIYVESFPIGSATASLEIMFYKIPMLLSKISVGFDFDSLKPFRVSREQIPNFARDILRNLDKETAPETCLNTNSHLPDKWNELFDQIIFNPDNYCEHNFDFGYQNKFEEYDVSLRNQLRITNDFLISSFFMLLSLKNKIRYLGILIAHDKNNFFGLFSKFRRAILSK